MRNDSMYFTMYNESLIRVNNQKKIIDDLKLKIEFLETEMEMYKTKMRKELMRLQKKLGEKNDNDWVDY